MLIGVPREIKEGEHRVGLTPSGVEKLASEGHRILVEREAGSGSGFTDEEYERAGAVLTDQETVWNDAELIVKVKEPIEPEFRFLRENLTVFTFLHLAAAPALARILLEKKVTAIAYETVMDERGNLPLLRPMSQIAGALSIQAGARGLEKFTGGRGVLLSEIEGISPATVTIVGAGTAGTAAAKVATGIGARVTILDVNPEKLKKAVEATGGKAEPILSTDESLKYAVESADLLILTVLIPGKKAPKLISEEMVHSMKEGSCLVDISIDQGGAAETSRPTTHANPYYTKHGVVHYCVTNMPSAVANTSTRALTSVTLPYVLELAGKGVEKAIRENEALRKGLNTHGGVLTSKEVAESLGL